MKFLLSFFLFLSFDLFATTYVLHHSDRNSYMYGSCVAEKWGFTGNYLHHFFYPSSIPGYCYAYADYFSPVTSCPSGQIVVPLSNSGHTTCSDPSSINLST